MTDSNLIRLHLPLHPSFNESCGLHHHFGESPCPWPDCPNGIQDDCFGGVTPGVPGHEETKYIRKSWKALDGSARFAWNDTSFFSFLDSSWLITQELIRCLGPDPQLPEVIYHYTSIEALFKIIGSNEFWLTDYAYMNDTSEIIHGLEVAKKAFREIEHIPRNSEQNKMMRECSKLFEVNSLNRIYLACFSTDDDNLSQWKGYGGSNTGVCIGLDTKKISFWYNNAEMLLKRVVYEEAKQLEILRNVFHIYFTALDWDKDKKIYDLDGKLIPPEKVRDSFNDCMGSTLHQFILFFKNEAFKDEKEIRWVYPESKQLHDDLDIPPAKTRFRVKDNQIIPYIATSDLTNVKIVGRGRGGQKNYKLPIKHIVVGPQENALLVIAGLKEYLSSLGYNPNIVRPSLVPFRSSK